MVRKISFVLTGPGIVLLLQIVRTKDAAIGYQARPLILPSPLKQQKWRCDTMKNLGRIPTPFGQDFSSKVITPEQGCIS